MNENLKTNSTKGNTVRKDHKLAFPGHIQYEIHPESIVRILNLNILHKKSRSLTSFKKKITRSKDSGPTSRKALQALGFPTRSFSSTLSIAYLATDYHD